MDSSGVLGDTEETSKQMLEGLLTETRIPDSFNAKVQSWVKELQVTLNSLKPSNVSFAANRIAFQNLLPAQVDVESVGEQLAWRKPTAVYLVGSFGTDCAVLQASHVDILLEIPQDCMHRSDLLNHKYHVKRALYILTLAEKLKKKNYKNLQFTHPSGDPVKPVLEIRTDDFIVRLRCSPPDDFFKHNRLLPDKNNLRFNHFYKKEILLEAESSCVGTPHYNFSAAEDIFAKVNHEFLQQELRSKSLRDVVILLKIWLKQRMLIEGYGGFSGFIAAMYTAYLVRTNQINSAMTTYQILKIALNHLSSSNWDKEGISFSTNEEVLKQWQDHSDIVFLDSSGVQNFTANMSKFTFYRVKYEAAVALKNLKAGNLLNFQSVFMRHIPFLTTFDHIIQFRDTSHLEEEIQLREELQWAVLNHSGNLYPVIVSLLGSIIEKCLSNRVELIGLDIPPTQTLKDPFRATPKNQQQPKSPIRFGLTIRKEAALKLVEKCESEDPETVKEFKDFWGELSQLRRFRDGSMSQAVVFTENKARVCYEMVRYAIGHHLRVDLESSVTNYLDLQLYSLFEPEYLEKGPEFILAKAPRKRKRKACEKPEEKRVTVDDVCVSATSSFEKISKNLRELEGLPLAITSVQCISPVFRSAHPFPTPPQRFFTSELLLQKTLRVRTAGLLKPNDEGILEKVPKLVEPLNVLLQLETTNKWPDNLRAIERLKAALLINIGQGLRSQFGLTVHAYSQYLDVLLDGFIFRLRLFYQRELILLKEVKDSDGVVKIKDNAESQDLEKEGIQLPRLTSTLHSFQHQFEPFGKVCRLAKRWLAAHLMLGSSFNFKSRWDSGCTLTEEAVELLVASLFLNPAPHPCPPNEAQTGFLRFLDLLARTDWESTPLIVNFNEALSAEDVRSIERDFAKRRQFFPPLFIATPADRVISYWTRSVHRVILKRVALLADTALKFLTAELLTSKFTTEEELRGSMRKMFISPLDHFDVIIWLKRNSSGRSYQNVKAHPVPRLLFKKYEKGKEEFIPVVDFDPVRLYLEELRNNFGHLAMFFNDAYGGDFLTVVWKPDMLHPKDFSVSNVKGRRFTGIGDKLELNIEGVLEAFQVLGNGIVERIETKSENWKV